MPRGPLDILKKVLGMHAQVVTKLTLATSGQLITTNGTVVRENNSKKWSDIPQDCHHYKIYYVPGDDIE